MPMPCHHAYASVAPVTPMGLNVQAAVALASNQPLLPSIAPTSSGFPSPVMSVNADCSMTSVPSGFCVHVEMSASIIGLPGFLYQ